MKILPAFLAFVFSASIVFAQETPDAPTFSVDFSNVVGVLKPLNGVNLWTNFSFHRAFDRQDLAEQCRISTVRLHDVPWDNNGVRLVDVHQIFANLNADPAEPKNYFFEATDDYIQQIFKGGAAPIYRLGTSIEHTEKPYFAKRPKYPERYAEICAAIVRHYNEGWKDGFHWNIQYWEIWNEPDCVPSMWDDPDWDSYCSFYVIVAKRLRAEFPNIKIGGPSISWADFEKIGRLLEFCQKENAPLDFFSWHVYTSDPNSLINAPRDVRKFLDDRGFNNTELHLNEWRYLPDNWQNIYDGKGDFDKQREMANGPEGMNGYISAAFNDFVLTRWQDGPLDMANYYAYELEKRAAWGTFDLAGEPRPTYYSLRVVGEMIAEAPQRVATTDEGGNVALIASINKESGAKRLLVSAFNSERAVPLEIALNGVEPSGKVKVGAIDAASSYREFEVDYANGVLKLDAQPFFVYYVRF